ncbi:MAG: manganese efflux pump MntP family protein [Lachnospiraceae bacterium]|nr:manganese efflux pump MntP family protein [Lachnospiraceae bacterium]
MNLLLFFINSIALGIGLAMDAFSVSLANGLKEPAMNKKRMLSIAGVFSVFQCLMPLTGYFLVHTAAELFTSILPFIPWIALGLLLFIGGKMLLEGISEFREAKNADVRDGEPAASTIGGPGFRELMVQGIATSIDALSVGFTIVKYQVLSAVIASLIIGIITLVICLAGLRLGKLFGMRLSRYAAILGGLILTGIGLEIWITGVFF